MNRNNHNFARKAKLAKLLRGDLSQAALKDLERLIRRHNMPLTRNTSVGPKVKLMRQNLRTAKRLYRGVNELQLSMLREIGASLQLSISSGDLILLEGRWYVTHSGLLRTARRMRCSGITTELEGDVSNPTAERWVFKATVCQSGKSSSATAMRIRPMFLGSCAVPKCVSRRPERSTAPCVRLTASAFAQSKRSVLLPRRRSLQDKRASSRRNRLTGTTEAQRSAIACAKSSGNTNSIPTW